MHYCRMKHVKALIPLGGNGERLYGFYLANNLYLLAICMIRHHSTITIPVKIWYGSYESLCPWQRLWRCLLQLWADWPQGIRLPEQAWLLVQPPLLLASGFIQISCNQKRASSCLNCHFLLLLGIRSLTILWILNRGHLGGPHGWRKALIKVRDK